MWTTSLETHRSCEALLDYIGSWHSLSKTTCFGICPSDDFNLEECQKFNPIFSYTATWVTGAPLAVITTAVLFVNKGRQGVCGRQKNSPKYAQHPKPQEQSVCYLTWQKDFADVVKGTGLGRVDHLGLSRQARSNHMTQRAETFPWWVRWTRTGRRDSSCERGWMWRQRKEAMSQEMQMTSRSWEWHLVYFQ